ncbi:hypothetical protein H2198_009750 [Neophaeococcomyces mojaviensis]|uniref:Uncharacterized protein n=1 Tax=Neophaeococcomyces mojaviensis TaxID=3383035 RepID=A0ACC2ZTN3_9EURO|nr:hypothetical protein H2198_009750 [Knufia sp. JES_112]
MSRPYASFKVDPSITFDNFRYNQPSVVRPASIANFSRPMSIRPALSHSTSTMTFSLPPLSRSSSSESLSGPATPDQVIAMPIFRVGPVTTIDFDAEPHSEKATHMPSFLLDDRQSPELDLRFSFERRSSYEVEASLPTPQLLKPFSARDRHTRPPTAPSALSQTSFAHYDQDGPHSAPPTVTSFAEFRQALEERQEARRVDAARKGLPALPFLSQDPFQCPLTGMRPRSARRAVEDDDVYSRPVSMKSSAPSVMSSRSTKSFKKGLSKVKRLFGGSQRRREKIIMMPA